MRPPFCAYCGELKTGSTLVGFADHRPLPDGTVGHPPGLEWFCASHAAGAAKFQHLPLDEALRRMHRRRCWERLLPGRGPA